jgi:GGDEF domain-containing protein
MFGQERFSPGARKAKRIDARTLRSAVLFLVNRSSIRYALLMLPIMPLAWVMANFVVPEATVFQATEIARTVANELNNKEVGEFGILQVMHKENLAWCYYCSDQGKLLSVTRSFAPPLGDFENRSRAVVLGDIHYYEAVTEIQPGTYLHVGIRQTPSILSDVSSWTVIGGSLVLYFLSVALLELVVVQPVLHTNRLLAKSQESGTLDRTVLEKERSSWLITAEAAALIDHFYLWLAREEQSKKQEEDKRQIDWKRWKQVQTSKAAQEQEQDFRPVSAIVQLVDTDWEKSLDAQTSSDTFVKQFLEGLKASLPQAADSLVFLRVEKDNRLLISHHFWPRGEQLTLLQDFSQRQVSTSGNVRTIDIGPLSLRRMGQELLVNRTAIRRVVFVPLTYQSRVLGFIGLFCPQEDLLKPNDVHSIQRLTERVSPFLFRLILREEAAIEQWTDKLTGLRNRLFLQNFLTNLCMTQGAGDAERPFALLFFVAESAKEPFATLTAEMQDSFVQEMSKLVSHVVGQTAHVKEKQVVRFQQHTFACVIAPAVESAANELAERAQKTFQEARPRLGILARYNLHVGFSVFPFHARSVDDLIAGAQSALDYAEESNMAVAAAAAVPSGFTPQRRSAMVGELGVLEASTLLQSINTSQKTGLLSVDGGVNRVFLAAFNEGKLTHAQLGPFNGMDAAVEFIVHFKTGKFKFNQTATAAEIPAAATPSMERCLMEAALAEDNLNMARKGLQGKSNIVVRAIDNPEGWEAVAQNKDITDKERQAMKEICQYATGNETLDQIWRRFENMPTHMKWQASYLLVTNKLVEEVKLTVDSI